MNDQRPKSEFTDVDHASCPENYVELLDVQQSMAFNQRYKQYARTLLDLHQGLQILDAGTGIGEDAREMAAEVTLSGFVVGLDLSRVMINIAHQRNQDKNVPVTFVQGDIHHLSFADNSFDRCYADRTFQHLNHPEMALSELIRVTKHDGLLVIVDPDHETQVLDSPFIDVTRRFFQFRNEGIRQPDIAHRLYALFKEAGLVDIQVFPLTRITTNYDTIRPVARFIEGMEDAYANEVVTKEETEQWIAAFEKAITTGRFFHAITSFITRGRKP
jgi:ubiquinone/menaquinone biosynthesis C-methylase UbiE